MESYALILLIVSMPTVVVEYVWNSQGSGSKCEAPGYSRLDQVLVQRDWSTTLPSSGSRPCSSSSMDWSPMGLQSAQKSGRSFYVDSPEPCSGASRSMSSQTLFKLENEAIRLGITSSLLVDVERCHFITCHHCRRTCHSPMFPWALAISMIWLLVFRQVARPWW